MKRCKSFRPIPWFQLPYAPNTWLTGLVLFMGIPNAKADHVLISPGRGLFNVSVETSLTTPTSLATIRVDPALSFGLDVGRGMFPVQGMLINAPVLDYELTTSTVGKEEARRKLEFGVWLRHKNPAPRVLVLFTPAPTRPPATTSTPRPTPDPRRIADKKLSLTDRVTVQLDIFAEEQKTLVAGIPESQRRSPESLRMRVGLLDEQIQLYRESFTSQDLITSSGLEALLNVRGAVLERGVFAHEQP
jgi:hypothetical protein